MADSELPPWRRRIRIYRRRFGSTAMTLAGRRPPFGFTAKSPWRHGRQGSVEARLDRRADRETLHEDTRRRLACRGVEGHREAMTFSLDEGQHAPIPRNRTIVPRARTIVYSLTILAPLVTARSDRARSANTSLLRALGVSASHGPRSDRDRSSARNARRGTLRASGGTITVVRLRGRSGPHSQWVGAVAESDPSEWGPIRARWERSERGRDDQSE